MDSRLAVRVLVIGPEGSWLSATASRLRSIGFTCETVAASQAALRGCLSGGPDVLVALEVGGSWQPTRRLMARDLPRLDPAGPPILVISDGITPDERADAMGADPAGIADWVDVSCPDREIAARIGRLARIRRMEADLEDLARRCAGMETVDRLTGLPNHRAFQELVAAEFRRAERYGSPLSLILLDIDRFRSLNEAHGHLWGDRLLQRIAAGLRRAVRETDMTARYGGEEFALLLPETGPEAALAVTGRARALLDALEDVDAGGGDGVSAAAAGEEPIRVTASFGLASYPGESTATRALLVASAEAALRRAKHEGRNRAVVHEAAVGPGWSA